MCFPRSTGQNRIDESEFCEATSREAVPVSQWAAPNGQQGSATNQQSPQCWHWWFAISTPSNIMLQKSRKKKHQRNIKKHQNINPRGDVQQTITNHHLWGTFIAKRRTWDGFSIEVEILTCYWWLGPQLVLTTTNDNPLNQQIFAKLQIYLATARIVVRIICNIQELRSMSPWEPQRTGTLSCINKWVAAAMTSEEIAWIFQWHEISRKARWYLLCNLLQRS